MENIIAQQLVKMQEEILDKIQKDGLGNIGETAEALFQIVKENTRELLRAILEATDAAIAEAKAERNLADMPSVLSGKKRIKTLNVG